MKTKLILIMAALILTGSLFADEITIFEGSCYRWNKTLKSLNGHEYWIRYETETNKFYLKTYDFINTIWVELDHSDIEKMRETFTKYLEWESKAVSEQVKIEKEIPESNIRTISMWKSSKYHQSNSAELAFLFFSQTKNWHQLVIFSNKMISKDNEYIDCEIEGLYIDKEDVELLLNGISEENIKIKMDEYNELQKKEDMFN